VLSPSLLSATYSVFSKDSSLPGTSSSGLS
jgi:hypothetical protein